MKANRIQDEKGTVGLMIDYYCKKKHRLPSTCESCSVLKQYAFDRLDKCVYGNAKSACSKCTVHCYKPAMRENIRTVMRYSGPRMLYVYPMHYLRHFWVKLHTV